MSDQGLPVTVPVARADGRVEHVRVGTAYRTGDGFTLRLGDLAIGVAPSQSEYASSAPRASTPIAAAPGGGAILPNYGRSKGQPIAGATMQDLEYYANGCRRTLADAAKSRWHDKERVLLAAIEAEIARQKGGVPEMPPADDAPPPSDDDVPF